MAIRLDRKFEKFLGGPTLPPETRVHVSIDRRGVMTFNATCFKLLGKPTGVYLYFSPADDTIAIEPTSGYQLPGVFPFKPNGSAKYINSAPFCRNFGIRLDATHRFISPDFSDDVLYLKLSETVIITRNRRMQKKKKD